MTAGEPEAASATAPRTGRQAPEHGDPTSVPLNLVMAALAEPMRLEVVRALAAHPDWSLTCGAFDLPVGKAARSHHFRVLRQAGLIEQRDVGSHRLNRLRRAEFDHAFPGLLDLVLDRPDRVDTGSDPDA